MGNPKQELPQEQEMRGSLPMGGQIYTRGMPLIYNDFLSISDASFRLVKGKIQNWTQTA